MAENMYQAIILTNDGLVYWRIYASHVSEVLILLIWSKQKKEFIVLSNFWYKLHHSRQ